MTYKKYTLDNNIIHEACIDSIDDIRNLIPDYDILVSIYQYNEIFINDFKKCQEDNTNDININIRYQKEHTTHGTHFKMNKVLSQNVNCYKKKNINKPINIYYDLTNKYNSNNDITLKRFVTTYILIKKLKKLGYNVNFIPVLFLKAFDSQDNNEYVYIKFNNISIDNILKYDLITNDEVSRILLPELIKLLNIVNNNALDYNGYLLERYEKEKIIKLENNDLIVDMFTSDDLYNVKQLTKQINK